MATDATQVTEFSLRSDNGGGITAEVRVDRLGPGRVIVTSLPKVSDVPDDVRGALLAWLLPTRNGLSLPE